jgi:hypothetical protein
MTDICECSKIKRYTQGRLGHPSLCVKCGKPIQTYDDFYKENPAIEQFNEDVNKISIYNFYMKDKMQKLKLTMMVFIISTILLLISNWYAYSCPAHDWPIEEDQEEREWIEFKEFLELIDCEDRR